MNRYKKNILFPHLIRFTILLFFSISNYGLAQLSEYTTFVEQFISPNGSVSGLCYDGYKLWYTWGLHPISAVNTSGIVIREFFGPQYNTNDVCFDGEYLWIATYEDGFEPEGIFCVDTLRGDIITVIPNPSSGTDTWSQPDGIAWDGHHLWICNYNGELFKITREGTVVSIYNNEDFFGATDLTWDGEYLWILGGGLKKINPINGEILNEYNVGGDAIAFDGTNLWLVLGGGPGGWDRFYKLMFSKGVRLYCSPSIIDPLDTWKIEINSDQIKDSHGAVIPDGSLFTISTNNGVLLVSDIDNEIDGIQISSVGGRINCDVIDFNGSVTVTVTSIDTVYQGFSFSSYKAPEYDLSIKEQIIYPISIKSGNGSPDALSWDGHSFWVCDSDSIRKINMEGTQIKAFKIPYFDLIRMWPNGLVFADNYLYLQADNLYYGLWKIAKIDTLGNAIDWIDHPGRPGFIGAGDTGLTWDGNSLWACGSDNLENISISGEMLQAFDRDYFTCHNKDVAWDGQFLWIIGRWNHILKIDPKDGDILEQYEIPSVPWDKFTKATPSGITWIGSDLWIFSWPKSSDPSGYFFRLGGISYENSPPMLSDGIVTPNNGSIETLFVFEILYTDANGDSPSECNVFIDGIPYTMENISGTYAECALYQYTTYLTNGNHNYYFSFNDGHNHRIRLPESGTYGGPEVTLTNVENPSELAIPKEYDLSQNFPNPFNPITTIKYQLPKTCHVTVKIYNMIGKEVSILLNKNQGAGYYNIKWDGKNNASGIYFCYLRAESMGDKVFEKVNKMLLVK